MIGLLQLVRSAFRMGNDCAKEHLDASRGPYAFAPFRLEEVTFAAGEVKRLPKPRSGHRIVCDSQALYSYGGFNPMHNSESDLFRELWKYNFALRKWTLYANKNSMPMELASNAVWLQGTRLMVFGGTGLPFGDKCCNTLHVCDLSDSTAEMYKVDTKGDTPLAQYGQALICHNDYLYTIGGTTGLTYTCDIHRLNLRTAVWEEVYLAQGQSNVEPAGRYRHEVVLHRMEIYILGGGTADSAFSLSHIPIFNLTTRTWRTVRTKSDPVYGFPRSRRCHGAVQVSVDDDVHVFISGGINSSHVFRDVWKLELNNLRWSMQASCSLRHSTYFHSAAVTPEGKMFIFGGIHVVEQESERNNEVRSAWVCIPKLAEICWEAILHYSPNLAAAPRERLIAMGLPRCYIERLH